ncbi:MAG: transporter [Herbaspirillum sp.]|jgi:hypothetical protein|nr:transporter [Herbaspirillum sp.]
MKLATASAAVVRPERRESGSSGAMPACRGDFRRASKQELDMTMTKRFASGFASAFLALSLLSMAGCGSTPTRNSPGGYIDDTVITTKVKAAFVKDPDLKATEIKVETFKGTVQLSGFVDTQEAAARAGSVARGVEGVKDVKNDIRLK